MTSRPIRSGSLSRGGSDGKRRGVGVAGPAALLAFLVAALSAHRPMTAEPVAGKGAAGPPTSDFVVEVRPPTQGLRVLLDGRDVGTTDGNGAFLAEAVEPGEHEVAVVAEDGTTHRVIVAVSELTRTFEVDISREGDADASGKVAEGGGRPPSSKESSRLPWAIGAVALLAGVAAFVLIRGRKGAAGAGMSVGSFAGYEMVRQIGRGGMASVYEARAVDGATVALKVMDEGLVGDEDLTRKFLREGELLRRLNSEAPEAPVVRVIDFGREGGREDGRPYLVLEMLRGESVADQLRKGRRWSDVEAVAIVRCVAAALAPAHERGIFHRDSTPDNVIILEAPSGPYPAKLIDFGVARSEYTALGTLDGSILGKPAYMSPEQARGEKVDAPSDVYAMGVLLFALVTGTPPFVHRNPLEVLRMHQQAEPEFPLDFPPRLEPLVRRMLEKQAADRPKDARAVLGLLESIA